MEKIHDTKPKDYVYQYSCAMLNLSEDVAPIIRYWAEKNIDKENLYIDNDSGIEGFEYIPHVTIKYGLHDIKPDKLIELVDGCGPIQLTFGKVSKFDTNPNFDVIKIEIESEKLNKLNSLISDNMDNTDKFDEYKPHATIAYVEKGTCDDLIENEFFDKLKDEVSQIYFTSRDGEESYIGL
jgi:hypothetical protein